MIKLEAVNWLLEHVGTEGVAALPATHPQAIVAENKLDLATRILLTEGWWFNTNYEVYLEQDITGYLIEAGSRETLNVTFRNKNLRQEGSNIADATTQQWVLVNTALCETHIILLPWDMIPIQAQSVILYMAAIDFIRSEIEDEAKIAVLSETVKGLASALSNQNRENLRVNPNSSKYLLAINFVLNAMGVDHVYSEESTVPEAMKVKERLNWVNEDLQSKLWWFNVDRNIYLTEVLGVIPETPKVLGVIPVDRKYVLQGNKFRDTSLGIDVPATDVLCESVSYKLSWDKLPKVALSWIKVVAALDIMSSDMNHGKVNQPYENDQSKLQPLNFMKAQLEIRLKEEDLRQRRLNIQDSTRVGKVLARVRPYGRRN